MSNETKHTPREWEVIDNTVKDKHDIHVKAGNKHICSVHIDGLDPCFPEEYKEDLANAHLIAAAPKMHDAIEAAQRWFEAFINDEPIWEDVPAADIYTILDQALPTKAQGGGL